MEKFSLSDSHLQPLLLKLLLHYFRQVSIFPTPQLYILKTINGVCVPKQEK